MSVSRGTFLAGAASAVALRPRASRASRIVIVGGGVAGCTCAYRLQQAGIASTLYEASDRIGGRTWTLRDYFAEGQIAEHGGEFISLGQHHAQRLARELGLHLVNVNHHERGHDIYYFDGATYTPAQAKADYDEQLRSVLDAAAHSAGYPTKHDRYTAAGKALDNTSVADWIEANVPGGMTSRLGSLLANACVGEYGGDPSVQSALNLLFLLGFQRGMRFNIDGTNEALHIEGGNDQLATTMAAALPAGTVNMNSALVALRELSDGSLRCSFASGSRSAEVDADIVCLAMPFTTLRMVDTQRVRFSRLKRIAIDSLDLGTNAKLHMQFKRRIWTEQGYDGASYVQFPYEESWEVSAAQPGRYGILVGFPGGRRGVFQAAAHGPAPAALAQRYVAELDTIYPGIAQQYTGLAYLDEWARDPWHHGAYSYYRVGQYTQFAGVEPLPERNVFFAGEQTSYNDMGYINGAVVSGERAAREIAHSL